MRKITHTGMLKDDLVCMDERAYQCFGYMLKSDLPITDVLPKDTIFYRVVEDGGSYFWVDKDYEVDWAVNDKEIKYYCKSIKEITEQQLQEILKYWEDTYP